MYNSLDIFRKSFLGCIPGIWQNEVPICLCQDVHSFEWRTVVKDIQNVILYVIIDVTVMLCLSYHNSADFE